MKALFYQNNLNPKTKKIFDDINLHDFVVKLFISTRTNQWHLKDYNYNYNHRTAHNLIFASH